MDSDIPPPLRKLRGRKEFSCSLHSSGLNRMMSVRRMRVGVCFRQNDFHFRHRNHWQEPDEQEKQGSENSERANERPNVDPGWNEQPPGRGDEIAMQPADDDVQ